MRKLKLVFVTLMLLVSSQINASLIDNGTFTSDSQTGLDWLDLSETAGLTYQDSLSTHLGWRYATNAEIEQLFSLAFPNFVETSGGHPGSGDTYDPASAFYNEAASFNILYGTTYFWAPSLTSYSLGYYKDEDGVMRMMGVRIRPGNATIYGTEYVGDFGVKAAEGDPYYGTYLVRGASAVPIPATAWLFGSALFGLFGFKRCRK